MSVKAYSYARFSSRAQAEGDSLRRQLSAAYEYAEKHGLLLDTSLRDLGVSAYTGDNRTKGALRSFLDRVGTGEIAAGSFLLIDSMDRLSRQMVTEATYQLLGIALAGITIVTLSDGRSIDRNASMADVMMAVVEIERSHRESADKARKVLAAHKENKRRARDEHRVWTPVGPSWLKFNDATGKFDEIPDKVRVVKRMFDMFESGMSATIIAEDFNGKRGGPREETLRPTASVCWGRDTVTAILKSRAVLGEYQPNKNDPDATRKRSPDGPAIPNYYGKGIIEPNQFARVQSKMRRPAPRGANSKTFNNLFIGLMKCSECGGTVGVHVNKAYDGRKRISRLRCVEASTGGVCNNRTRLAYLPLEASFLKAVTSFELPGERKSVDPNATALAQAIAQRDTHEGRVNNLLNMLADGDDRMRAFYAKEVAALDAKEAEIKGLKALVEAGEAKMPAKASQASIELFLERMASANEGELYSLRAAVAQNIKNVVDTMEMRPDGTVLVNVFDGYGLYEFRDGTLVANHGSYMATQPFNTLVFDKDKGEVVRVETDPDHGRRALHGDDPAAMLKLDRIIAADLKRPKMKEAGLRTARPFV